MQSELYFPLPWNKEQVQIAERLAQSHGTVVQGPPGTGKTHTIANIICHYLARGKRVLVTSKGEPALAVLREKIPEGIRDLAVSLLASEREGMKQFEHAISKVAAEVTRINPVQMDSDIKALRGRLEALHEQRSAIDRDIASYAHNHLKKITLGGKSLRPEELARTVLENEPTHGWLTDPLTRVQEPHFTDRDIQALRTARLRLGGDIAYFDCSLPLADDLPDGLQVLRLHRDLVQAQVLEAALQDHRLPPLRNTSDDVRHKAAELASLVREVCARSQNTDVMEDWHTIIIAAYRSHNGQVRALDAIHMDIRGLANEREEMMLRPVDLPSAVLDHADTEQAIARLAEGRRAFHLPFGSSASRRLLTAIRVAGRPANTADDWSHVQRHIVFCKTVQSIATRWNALQNEFGVPVVEPLAATTANTLSIWGTWIERVRQTARDEFRLRPLIEAVFGTGITVPPTFDEAFYVQLTTALDTHLRRDALAHAWQGIESIKAKLAGKTGAVVERIQAFLAKQIGSPVSDADIQSGWSALLGELRRLADLREPLAEVARVTTLVSASGAACWSEALTREPTSGGHDRLTPVNWLEAWQWRRARTYLEEIDGRSALRQLQTQRTATDKELGKVYEEYIEKLTWLEVYRHASPEVKSALQAYLDAVMHIGKGTGVRAIRYRAEARSAMLRAYQAVPCLIMPHFRVSETLPAEIGAFDLVVVDEASQSDLWALPCLLRGKQLLIVGDDKQVSPDAIGLEEAKIVDLKKRYLAEQHFGDQMTPERSVYDLARVVFAGNLIVLREHFRCVEPIIQFSNRVFYENTIRPLRIPKASERIDPPLVDVFVKGGYRERNVNPPEGRAIVDEIERVIADPQFARRTIGVVSLLGSDQAHYIFKLMNERLPMKEIIDRQIAVGDARTFQGKERDIMMLSMVATKEQSVTATRRDFEQRFNVAASRARDRMYLFRSVERSDLKAEDLKAKLLEHFERPYLNLPEQVADLRMLCESGFETELFDELCRQGYRVTPQVTVGAYRIDMVVEGNEDRRLAIECDGDKFHGPERWSEDSARQRVLERAGWTFWCCFASSFVMDRKGCLQDLYATLERLGIGAIGRATGVHHGYTEKRVIDPETDAKIGETPATAVAPVVSSSVRVNDIPEFVSSTKPPVNSTGKDPRGRK